MHTEGDEIHVDDTEASGGSKEGVVRWILGIGLLLAVALMTLVWVIPALSQGDIEEEATVSGELRSMDDGDANQDSIIIEDDAVETDAIDGDAIAEPEDTLEN